MHRDTSSRLIYTAMMGNYEALQEQPQAANSGIPLICLTDNPDLTSETWQIVHVQPRFPVDHVRSARALKIMGHPAVDGADQTLWIDNRVVLTGDPHATFDGLLGEADLGCCDHSFRDTVLDEFAAVIAQGRDDHTRISEQFYHYAQALPEILDQRPLWTGMLARRRTEQVGLAMQTWWEHVLRYSRRDQLSLPAALALTNTTMTRSGWDNWQSDHHQWLRPSSAAVRRVKRGKDRQVDTSVVAPALQVSMLTGTVEDLERRLAEAEERAQRAEKSLARIRGSRSYRWARKLGKVRG